MQTAINMKPLFSLFLLIPLLGSSCISKNVLVKREVSTLYITNSSKNIWEGIDARKKISVKSLRVLVVDRTDVHNKSQALPFYPIFHSEEPYQKDTVIESAYYNQQVFNAFKQKVPLKADIQTIFSQVSKEELDSLIQTEKYDLVIAARRISIHSHFDYHGISDKNAETGNTSTEHTKAIYRSVHRTTGQEEVRAAGPYFEFRGDRMPPLLTHTLTWQTDWDLYWITRTATSPKHVITHLTQEGRMTHHSDSMEEIVTLMAREAGKGVAQVFTW